MVFSPAWGGVIPLVPIGSFRGFLASRGKGKNVKTWFTGSITRVAISAALRTPTGVRAAKNISGILRAMGFRTSPSIVGVELQAYIAFQKFQHQQAVKQRNIAKQRKIERAMALPRDFPQTRANPSTFPELYFQTLAERGTPGPNRRREREQEEAVISWFERRRRRRGRFVNVV